MRMKINETDFNAISRRSIQKDFQRNKKYPEKRKAPQIQNLRKTTDNLNGVRIAEISDKCEYVKFARLLVGKKVNCVNQSTDKSTSGWYEFVFDEDRQALNKAAGWSDKKKMYLLTRPKLR